MAAAVVMATGTTHAQEVTIVKNGRPDSRIVIAGSTAADTTAAILLQRFVRESSGAELPVTGVTPKAQPRKGDIVISSTANALTEDAFRISTEGGIIKISGNAKGTIYGAVTLLERCLGMNYWSENEYTCPKHSTIVIPSMRLEETPAFRYRQSQNYAMRNDKTYTMWHRLEEPREVFAGGYWVHTFDRLLPSKEYGKTHPEYYAYFNGKRHPGEASQWCLANPEVLEIVAARVDSIFKANPGKNIISISQNDGNNTYCTCPECSATDKYEGAQSGSVIHFLNKLAARFPDKEFSTLAYLYTMKPPKHVKPLPNVNIMLCDIDCDREVTLTENRSGREFVDAMQGWSAISNNIFVWDYGINFDNYLAPFPNFHVLQPNIRLFKKNHVTMHFSQIAGSRGGDFAEMRTWLVAKLMWNPQADIDSLTNVFLHGYYADAAPYIYRYVKMMEGALIGSGVRLWIYDSPVTHKHGMLKPELMRRWNALFDDAEKAVAGDSTSLARVRRTRLPLQFSELEIARTETVKDTVQIAQKLALFEERAAFFKVPTINERNNSPLDYCKLYRQRYMGSGRRSLAQGAQVQFLVEPKGSYATLGKTALTDGLFGGATFVESWVGWEGVDGAFIIDMEAEKVVTRIATDFLQQLGAWILLPEKVTYSTSTDGIHFVPAGSYGLEEDRSPEVKFVQVGESLPQPVKARYIKVEVTGKKTCPSWHYGVGNPCWFFIDEVMVY